MFGKTALVFTTVLCLVALGESTEVSECTNGRTLDTIKSVAITNCNQPPCILKKRTMVQIYETFVPEKDVESLTTSVNAKLFGLPLPFIGVDGSDACRKIYDAEGKIVGCPLKAGTEYYYKNEFPVLPMYPQVSVVVYWALVEKGNPITCFEVASKISNS